MQLRKLIVSGQHNVTVPDHKVIAKGTLNDIQMWFDFDEGADVLYVSFERPQGATDSELDENGILTRYRGDRLVGVTILNARKRFGTPA